ncbi:MAG: iron chelate uptake ABC transporter family permease subunit, partial [Desulfobacterales bacterium]
MNLNLTHNISRLLWISLILFGILLIAVSLGLSLGPTQSGLRSALAALFSNRESDPVLYNIVWRIRLPRVLLATIVGATLSLGG